MSTQQLRRKDKNEPGNGGRYTSHDHSAPTATLDDPRQWGATGISEGSNTPWGGADYVTRVAPGIDFAGTPGHGGYKLSPERNALIPPAYRARNGWYEEDVEWRMAASVFPTEFQVDPEENEQALKDWFPTEWEKVNGRELTEGESRRKDELLWHERNRDRFVVTSASTSDNVPGMVRVTAKRDGDGAEASFLVPEDEYKRDRVTIGGMPKFTIDPSRHPKLPAAAPDPAVAARAAKLRRADESHVSALALADAYQAGKITAATRDRVAKDLGKMWRDEEGNVRSTRDIILENKVALTAYEDNGKMSYAIVQPSDGPGHYSYPITKATFTYLNGHLNDDRTPAQVARHEYRVAETKAVDLMKRAHEYERAARIRGQLISPKHLQKARDAQAEADRLRQRYEELEKVASEGGANAHENHLADLRARELAATITPEL